MASERMNRDEFFRKIAGLDDAALRTVLWTLYWRGTQPVRERIEGLIDPQEARRAAVAAAKPPDAAAVLAEAEWFVAVARAGAYLAGDRRVSPKERTRWRFTFRRLATDAQAALRGEDSDTAGAAVALLIDLACEMRGLDYFRSDDPVEAARFVVSDAAETLWLSMRDAHGTAGFLEGAVGQLARWESRYGWTRRGDGWVAERERPLADILARMLTVPDLWVAAARYHLAALDRVGRGRAESLWATQARASNLGRWHWMLFEHLSDPHEAAIFEQIATHPALAGAERTFLQVLLARQRGDLRAARSLMRTCLKEMPGHPGFRAFAEELGEVVGSAGSPG